MKHSEQDLDRLRRDLTSQIENISRDLLGSPVNRNPKRHLRYGSKGGSLYVTIDLSARHYGR